MRHTLRIRTPSIRLVNDHNEGFILEVRVGVGGEELKVPQTSHLAS